MIFTRSLPWELRIFGGHAALCSALGRTTRCINKCLHRQETIQSNLKRYASQNLGGKILEKHWSFDGHVMRW